MPGPYIHMSVVRHAMNQLADGYRPVGSDRIHPEWPGVDGRDLATVVRDHPNFAALGAIGPDLFFFLPDFRDVGNVQLSSVLVRILEFVESVYQALDPYISKYEKYLGPISEDTAEELSRLTGGLSESVGNITGELSSILITALEDLVTQQRDWWSFFSLGLNKGYDEQAYFWSDMLHYRQTGAFAQTLWRNALGREDAAAQAYSLGYLSHVATDTVAHAFVNQIAGGPFRLHWQRHHLVENHADADWYQLDPDDSAPRRVGGYDQLTESALYYDIAFAKDNNGVVSRPALPGGNTLRDHWVRRRLLDIDSEMPGQLANLVIDTMTDVFYAEGVPHPKILRSNDGRPNTELVQEAYRLLWRYLKIATVDGFAHEPPPPPDLFPNLDFPTPSDPAGDSPPGNDDGGDFWDDLLDFILSIINVLAYIVEVAIYLATLPWAILADIVTYPLRLGLYYALELPLFYLLRYFRSVLVRTAYLLPMADEIDQSLIGVGSTMRQGWQDMLADLGDVFAGLTGVEPGEDETSPFRDPAYPYVHLGDEFRHPWQYPAQGTPTERCPATAGPHGRRAGPPALFRSVLPSAEIRDRLETAGTPTETDRVGCELSPTNHLGDVVNMTKYTMWLATRAAVEGADPVPLTDWNLDADRGYGYHCWDWNRRAASEQYPPVPDPERNPFLQPCTWPSQTDLTIVPPVPKYDPNVPLQVHWAGPGLHDPGCQQPECVDCLPPIS